MDFDDRFVDVDFCVQPQFVFGDRGRGAFGSMRNFSDAITPIPQSQWPDECEKIEEAGGGNENYVTRIYNQGNEGSCVSNATGQAHEILQAKQFGKSAVIHLSAISLYKRVGRSPNSGSMLSDNLDEMFSTGILPLDDAANRAKFPHTMAATGFRSSYPTGWQETAKKFRFSSDDCYELRSVDALVTASLLGFPIVVGRSGHSIVYIRPGYRSGNIGFYYVNSWSENWGSGLGSLTGGVGWDSLSYVRSSAGWAFAPRAAISPQEI